MFVAERFIAGLARTLGKHPVSPDGDPWYPQACRFLNLEHHAHSLETAQTLMRAARVGQSDILARPAKGELQQVELVGVVVDDQHCRFSYHG